MLVYLAIVWAIVTGGLLLVLLAVTVAERLGLLHRSRPDVARRKEPVPVEAADELPRATTTIQ